MKRTMKPICAVLAFFLAAVLSEAPVSAAAAHSDTVLEGARVICSGTFESESDICVGYDISGGVCLLNDREFIVMDTGRQIRIGGNYRLDTAGYQNPFCEGLGLVYSGEESDRKFGFVDTTGKLVLPCEYEDAQPFSEGVAAVERDGKWGYIDQTGAVVIDYQFDIARPFSEGLAYISKVDKKTAAASYGYIGKNGSVVIDSNKYAYSSALMAGESLPGFSENRMAIISPGGFGYIDGNGNIVIEPQFAGPPSSFSEGLAVVAKRTAAGEFRYGYIDTSGNLVIDCEFEEAESFSNGIAWTSDGWIDRDGNILPIPHILLRAAYKRRLFKFKERIFYPAGTGAYGTYRYCLDGLMRIGGGVTSTRAYRDTTGRLIISSSDYNRFIYGSNFVDGRALIAFRDDENGSYVWQIIENPLYTDSSNPTARPTPSKIYIDGKEQQFDSFLINGNNYFKLRDIAYALSGTGVNFNVVWEPEINTIVFETDTAYIAVGGEMEGKGEGIKTPVRTSSWVYQTSPGEDNIYCYETFFMSYNIESNNYFKLRDIGRALGFDVTWDAETNSIIIETDKDYTPD